MELKICMRYIKIAKDDIPGHMPIINTSTAFML